MGAVKTLALVLLVALPVTALVLPRWSGEDPPDDVLPVTEEVVLFDGGERALDGWVFYSRDEDARKADVFRVEGDVLAVSGRPSGYLATKRWFKDYELELEWRWPEESGGGNSGVLVHTTAPLIFFGWPRSLEVQLANGNAGDFWVIGRGVDVRVEDEAERRAERREGDAHSHRRIRNLTDGSEKPIGEWNAMRVRCEGDEVRVWVNGELVNHGIASTISEGAVALQSEGRPVEFRGVRLSPLTPLSGEEGR